jgi:hypothetical protein
VLLLAPDMRQAKVSLDYAEGVLQSTPMMKQLLAARTADTLTLSNGIVLEVRSASFRRIRGMTCVAALADECAFWMSDDSANPDVEILNAVRPALATTGGPLIAISSPYARRGALWETYKRHYGPAGDPMILVAQDATRDFNPELPQSIIDRATWSAIRPLPLLNTLRSSELMLKPSSPERQSRNVFSRTYSSGHRSGSTLMLRSLILRAGQAMR